MEDMKYMIKVMQAYVNGETIEFASLDSDADNWTKADAPIWNWDEYTYRIKPKPKKVHFEYEDFIEEIKKNGGYVRYLAGKMISIIYPNTKEIIVDDGYRKFNLSYEDFCYKFTRLDGTEFIKEM